MNEIKLQITNQQKYFLSIFHVNIYKKFVRSSAMLNKTAGNQKMQQLSFFFKYIAPGSHFS